MPEILPVALFGKATNYHHQAAIKLFGSTATLHFFPNFAAVIAAVAGGTHSGVIAVRNSTIGSILNNEQLITQHSGLIAVSQYVEISIDHKLITATKIPLASIVKVISHRAALQQCTRWLQHHAHVATENRTDTAEAVREVCVGSDLTTAAIGSRYSANEFGGFVHDVRIVDQPSNITTFAALHPVHS